MKNNKHPEKVIGHDGSLEQLAQAIGNMTYNQVALFVEKLADDIKRQAVADSVRGRKKLAKNLYDAAMQLNQAKEKLDLAWGICKPYMDINT